VCVDLQAAREEAKREEDKRVEDLEALRKEIATKVRAV
jgi:hypothetical protein